MKKKKKRDINLNIKSDLILLQIQGPYWFLNQHKNRIGFLEAVNAIIFNFTQEAKPFISIYRSKESIYSQLFNFGSNISKKDLVGPENYVSTSDQGVASNQGLVYLQNLEAGTRDVQYILLA